MFDPKDFISLSKALCTTGLTEAQYRTAVSRALYGVFLWAREELAQRGEKVKVTSQEYAPDEHSKVRQCFKIGGHFRHDGVSQRLGGLYRLRNTSDYDLDANVEQSDLVQALQYVAYIKTAFETALFVNPTDSN